MSSIFNVFLKYSVNNYRFSLFCVKITIGGGDYLSFGTKLKEARTNKHLRQSDLGKLVGVSGQVISNLERGYTTGSSPDMIKKLATALDVSTEYLTENSSSEYKFDLTPRDEKNITKTLDMLKDQITNNQAGELNYNGIEVTDDDADLLLDAMEIALRRIKKKNKEKYTPNKYK